MSTYDSINDVDPDPHSFGIMDPDPEFSEQRVWDFFRKLYFSSLEPKKVTYL